MRASLLMSFLALGCSKKQDKPAPAPPPPAVADAAVLADATGPEVPALDLWTPNRLSRDGKLAIGRLKANDPDVLRLRIVEVETNKTMREAELRLLATLRSRA